MNKRSPLLVLCAAVFAVALVALPGIAHAEEIHLKQSDFDAAADGKYTLAAGNNYILDEDVTGCVYTDVYSDDPITLDLNGKTLTGRSDSHVIYITGCPKMTVSNGNLNQPNAGWSVVRIDGKKLTGVLTLDLGAEGYTVRTATSASHMCIDAEIGTVIIKSGRYINLNSDGSNAEVLRAGLHGHITVEDGEVLQYGGSKIAHNQKEFGYGSSVVLEGGSYSTFPDGISGLGTGKSLWNRSVGSKFFVGDTEEIKKDQTLNYYVATGSDVYGDVFFEPLSAAKQLVSDLRLSESSIHGLVFTVTFDSNCETKVVDAKVHYGYTVSKPSLTRDGYTLVAWNDADGNAYDFSSEVTSDLALTAQWCETVAKVGDVVYDSLQAAINAAGEGDTVTLCKDRTESVTIGAGKNLTLDLGGNTLTNSSKDAIKITGKSVLAVKNGTVKSTSGDCLKLASGSDGSTVTLGGGENDLTLNCVSSDSSDNAVCAWRAATININSGTYTSTGNYALNTFSSVGSSPVTISGGSFKSALGDASVVFNGGVVTISGGDFTGNVKKNDNASLAVSGGNIGGHVVKADDDTTLTITGGTFGDKTNEGVLDYDTYHMVIDGQRYKVGKHEWEIGFDGKNAKTHSKHCTVNGCGIHKDYERCSGGVATCQQGAVCTTCGGEYTDKDASNHVGIDADKGYQSDANGHWHLCSGCDERYESEVSAHTSATRTVAEPTYEAKGKGEEYCSVCGYVIREYDIDKLDPGMPSFVGLQSGLQYDGETKFKVTLGTTEVTPVVKYGGTVLECDSEGYYTLPVAEGEVALKATAGSNATSITVYSYADHDWSTAQAIGNGKHKKVCKRTGCGESVEGYCAAEEGAKATCTHGLICAECGDEYDKTRDLTNHTGLSEDWTQEGDVHYRLCSDCGAHVDEAEHAYAWFVDVHPEKGKNGHAYKYCTVCGHRNGEEKTIPWQEPAQPTLTGIENGGSYCAAGKDVTFTVSEEGNPEAIFTVVANGVRLAGTGNTFVLPAVNGAISLSVADGNGYSIDWTVYCYDSHDWDGNWTSAGDDTHYQTCKRCGAKSDPEPCSYDESSKPESDKDGHWHVCDVCGGKVDVRSHDFGSWQKTAEGCEHVCKDCGYEEVVDHKFGDWQQTASGCKRVCETCGYEEIEGHEFGEWETTATGHKHTCKTCGFVVEGAHSYGKWAETEDGSKHEHTCGDCGYKETAEHDYVWVTDKEATATEDGSAHEECKDCGHESGQTKVLPKTGGDDSGDGDDKGGKKDDSGKGNKGSKGSKGDPRRLPATGDPATIISGIAATGAALAATGAIRRRK